MKNKNRSLKLKSMELKKHPETEMEYWLMIEDLGGYIYHTNRGLSHDRIDDPKGEVAKSVIEARELQLKIVKELPLKFGVITPEDYPKVDLGEKVPLAPEGKIYYADWYRKMKLLSYGEEYENMICSACPFSKGLDYMIALGGKIPCDAFNGSSNRLQKPYLCIMVRLNIWSEYELFARVTERGGEEGAKMFKEKMASLKEKCAKDPKEE